jgi:hypothetical protein
MRLLQNAKRYTSIDDSYLREYVKHIFYYENISLSLKFLRNGQPEHKFSNLKKGFFFRSFKYVYKLHHQHGNHMVKKLTDQI